MNKQQGQYPISQSDVDELYRLSIQDELLNERFFYVPADLKPTARVLDVACGTGGWLRKIARLYPQTECIGVDKSDLLLDHARSLATSAGLNNIRYQQRDFFDFPKTQRLHFDLIYMRCASWFLGSKMQEVYAQCVQRLASDGTFAVSEFSFPFTTSSAAMRQFSALFFAALERRGTTHINTSHIPRLLHDLGLTEVQSVASEFDMGYGAAGREGFVTDFHRVLTGFKPMVLSTGQIDEETYEELAETIKRDMDAQDYRSSTDFVTITGRKV